MSKAEPKAELDASTTAAASDPSNDISGVTSSVENNKQFSDMREVAVVGQEFKEERNDNNEKMAAADNANANGDDPKMAEADDINNEDAEDSRKERGEDMRKEEPVDTENGNAQNMKKEKYEDTNKGEAMSTKREAKGNAEDMNKKEGKEEAENTMEEAKDATKAEAEDGKKEDGDDLKKEEAVVMKEEDKDTMKEVIKDVKKKESKDVKKGEICSVRDADMKDKEVGDEIVEEEKDNGEVKKNSEENKDAEGEAKLENAEKGELDNVKVVDMEDKELGVKNTEEVKDVTEEKDNKEIKEKVEESKVADGENDAKDVKVEEVDSTEDVDVENKEVSDKKIKDKDVTEENDNGERKRKDKDNKEAEREAEAGDMNRGEIESVKDVDMEDKEVRDKKLERDKDATEEKDEGETKKKVEESKEAKGEGEGSKKKRIRGQKNSEEGEEKEKNGVKKAKEISTPMGSSIERPVRERKSVERLVEALDNESVKPFIIEKGCGTPLMDIPNVAYKVAKKKPAQLKAIHQTLFGRIGKATDYKNHILQFSGFVWHESEDKQKTKVKEKLDKCIKDTLLDFCDLFDLPVLKAKSNARKEELVAMLLDFMVAPHATTDVILSEKEKQLTNSKKRKRGAKGSGSKSSGKQSLKIGGSVGDLHMFQVTNMMRETTDSGDNESEVSLNTKGKSTHGLEGKEDDDDDKNGVPSENDASEHAESKGKDIGSEAAADDEKDDNDSGKTMQQMKSLKNRGSADTKKSKVSAGLKKVHSPTIAKSPIKLSSSKHSKAEDTTRGGAKVLSRNETEIEQRRKKTVHFKTDSKDRSSGKKVIKGKAKSKESEESGARKEIKDKAKSQESGEAGPSKEELKRTICEILNRVDFNTATFTDIVKELAGHYGMDLTPRKHVIKRMVQEELTKLAEEDEEEGKEDGGRGGK